MEERNASLHVCVCVFDIIIRYPKKKKLHYEAISENI